MNYDPYPNWGGINVSDSSQWTYTVNSGSVSVDPKINRLEHDAGVMLSVIDLIMDKCKYEDIEKYDIPGRLRNLIIWGFIDEIEVRYGNQSDITSFARTCKTIEEAVKLVEVSNL